MVRPFRFAVQGGPFDDPERLQVHARHVEELGYDELYSFDHVGTVDPFVPLVVAALATERLRVGPLVLNNEFHHPALLARTAATVDRATGGRLVLGCGTGYMEREHESIGSPILPPGPRVTRFGESLEVLRSLLDTGACDFDGEHHHVHVEQFGVVPVAAHVPILIGGHGRRVVRLAARYADIFQFTGLHHGEGGVPSGGGFAIEEVEQRARWLAEDAGDRDDRIERSVLVQACHVGDDAAAKLDEFVERFQMPRELIEATPFVLAGSVEQVVEKLGRLRDRIGVSHVTIRDADGFAPVVAALAGR
ncbi:MAG: TIGR03621 family F420-dependent LLM class oxidoreductase [Acidimicrobiales bacterium]|nr:TIGR03621 family F420-dependent LLM class oxidoreductase [Acidimicrobiales bacterium]